jgi:hypothetical protein
MKLLEKSRTKVGPISRLCADPLPPAPVGGTRVGSFQKVPWESSFLGVKKDNGKLSLGLAY